MPVDASIYKNMPVTDIAGGVSAGMKMRDMYDNKQLQKQKLAEEQAYKDAFNKNMVQGEDGSYQLDKQKTMADLVSSGQGQKAHELQKQFKAEDLDEADRKLTDLSRFIGGANDPKSWAMGIAELRKRGYDTSEVPDEFDPAIAKRVDMMLLTAKDRLGEKRAQMQQDWQQKTFENEQSWKQKEYNQRERMAESKQDHELRKMAMKQQEKDKGAVKDKREFDNRYNNIKTAISTLKDKIDKNGTYEAFGAHNNELQALIDSVAIDSAKMFDPQSVARESEVKAFRDMLFEGGTLSMRNSTAKKILENYEKMLENRSQVMESGQPVLANEGQKQQSVASKPAIVSQNGVTFRLNPQTGEYEPMGGQ